jgi:hypothetical protein
MEIRPNAGVAAGWISLAIVCVLLGFRSYQVADAVLVTHQQTDAVADAASSGNTDGPAAHQVSGGSSSRPCGRNPFGAPSGGRPVRDEVTYNAPPEEAPELRALLFDAVDPSVQISVFDTLQSGWLRQGGRFMGWTVTKIERSSVTVAKAGKSVILSSP